MAKNKSEKNNLSNPVTELANSRSDTTARNGEFVQKSSTSRQLVKNPSSSGQKLVVREAVASSYGTQSLSKARASGTPKSHHIIEQVTGLATWVLGSVKVAKAFLNDTHPMLGGLTPLKSLETEEGRQQVERILMNIKYGLPA